MITVTLLSILFLTQEPDVSLFVTAAKYAVQELDVVEYVIDRNYTGLPQGSSRALDTRIAAHVASKLGTRAVPRSSVINCDSKERQPLTRCQFVGSAALVRVSNAEIANGKALVSVWVTNQHAKLLHTRWLRLELVRDSNDDDWRVTRVVAIGAS